MTDHRELLDRLLVTDPVDVGCDEAMAALHVYVDLFVSDHETAKSCYPGIAAHLAACGPCGDDFTGLLTVVTEDFEDLGDA